MDIKRIGSTKKFVAVMQPVHVSCCGARDRLWPDSERLISTIYRPLLRVLRASVLCKLANSCTLLLMGQKGRSQLWQLPVGPDSAKPFFRFQHARRRPAQGHFGVAPAFDIAGHAPNGAHHVFNDIAAGQRAAQIVWQAEAGDGEDIVDALQLLPATLGASFSNRRARLRSSFSPLTVSMRPRLGAVIKIPKSTPYSSMSGGSSFGEYLASHSSSGSFCGTTRNP